MKFLKAFVLGFNIFILTLVCLFSNVKSRRTRRVFPNSFNGDTIIPQFASNKDDIVNSPTAKKPNDKVLPKRSYPKDDCVALYAKCNYLGNTVEICEDFKDSTLLKSDNWEGEISSIKVGSNVKPTLYSDINYKGKGVPVDRDVSCLTSKDGLVPIPKSLKILPNAKSDSGTGSYSVDTGITATGKAGSDQKSNNFANKKQPADFDPKDSGLGGKGGKSTITSKGGESSQSMNKDVSKQSKPPVDFDLSKGIPYDDSKMDKKYKDNTNDPGGEFKTKPIEKRPSASGKGKDLLNNKIPIEDKGKGKQKSESIEMSIPEASKAPSGKGKITIGKRNTSPIQTYIKGKTEKPRHNKDKYDPFHYTSPFDKRGESARNFKYKSNRRTSIDMKGDKSIETNEQPFSSLRSKSELDRLSELNDEEVVELVKSQKKLHSFLLLSRLRALNNRLNKYETELNHKVIGCWASVIKNPGDSLLNKTLMIWNKTEFNKDPSYFQLSSDRTSIDVLRPGIYTIEAKITSQKGSNIKAILNISNKENIRFGATAKANEVQDANLVYYKQVFNYDNIAIFIESTGNGPNNELTYPVHRLCLRLISED